VAIKYNEIYKNSRFSTTSDSISKIIKNKHCYYALLIHYITFQVFRAMRTTNRNR